MKPAPERFAYNIQTAVNEAVSQNTKVKKHMSVGSRAVIAIALILVMIPTTVFGASKLYELVAKPVDNHGLELNIEREQTTDYPILVKMHVEIPEGFAEVPNTNGLKFYNTSTEEPYTDGYSLNPMRFYDFQGIKEYIGNVDSYEERMIDGHQAYEVNRDKGWDRLYIYYEDVNVSLLIYHKDVTDEQLEDFVKGISFTEGSEDDFTYLDEPSDEREPKQSMYNSKINYTELSADTSLTFKDYSYKHNDENPLYTARLSNIRTLDNISELDDSCFNPSIGKHEISDDNGYLDPVIIKTIKEGDGFDKKDEVLKSELKQQKLVMADITYINMSDEDIELFIPFSMNVLDINDNGKFTQSHIIDTDERIYSDDYCDGEITYLSPHGIGKSFYIPTLKANETMTVTVGFRCCSDVLDKAYFTMYNLYNVIEPQYNGDINYGNYIFKVQQDDR